MGNETLCADCGKPMPNGARLCPNCGNGVIPLPVLDGGVRAASAPASSEDFYTGSRSGDVAAGIALAVFLPLLIGGFFSAFIATIVRTGQSFGLAGNLSLVGSSLAATAGTPVFVARHIKRKYFVLGDAMQRMLFGLLMMFGVSLFGLLAVCVVSWVRVQTRP